MSLIYCVESEETSVHPLGLAVRVLMGKIVSFVLYDNSTFGAKVSESMLRPYPTNVLQVAECQCIAKYVHE